jgi:hypothetical protein
MSRLSRSDPSDPYGEYLDTRAVRVAVESLGPSFPLLERTELADDGTKPRREELAANRLGTGGSTQEAVPTARMLARTSAPASFGRRDSITMVEGGQNTWS